MCVREQSRVGILDAYYRSHMRAQLSQIGAEARSVCYSMLTNTYDNLSQEHTTKLSSRHTEWNFRLHRHDDLWDLTRCTEALHQGMGQLTRSNKAHTHPVYSGRPVDYKRATQLLIHSQKNIYSFPPKPTWNVKSELRENHRKWNNKISFR